MLRLLILLLWLPMAAIAQTYPDPLSDTVNDYAGLLPPDAQARISAALKAARDETGVHIVLVTINQQADYAYDGRFADFATGWFNIWGVGDKARNDGILILVSKDDREMRIALGRAYDVIWDGRAQRVLDTAMLPAFRADDYARGLEDGVQLAIDQLARPFAAGAEVTVDSGFPKTEALPDVVGMIVMALGALGIVFAIARSPLRDRIDTWRACPVCGRRMLRVTHVITQAAGEATQGKGVRHVTCQACGEDRSEPYTFPSRHEAARASSSSSDGFGGGSSGGGGASGKW